MREGRVCIGVVACDEGGDRLGAQLIAGLQRQRPALRFVGMAGARMQAQGGESYRAIEQPSAHDVQTALRGARSLRSLRTRLIRSLCDARPALCICVGAPELNVQVGRALRGAGVPSVHYAGPAVWNWRIWRVRRIASCLSHVLAVLPIEAAAYKDAGIPATFVGHPLADSVPLDVDKAAARAQLRLPTGKRIVVLIPGERSAEIRSTGEVFVKAAHRFHSEMPDVHFVLPVTSRRNREHLESALRFQGNAEFPLTLLFGHANEALAAADFALVSSEAASLAAMLFRTPMILAQPKLTITRTWSRQLMCGPTVGLPNRLAGEGIVPELQRRQVTPWAIAVALMSLMDDAQAQRRQVKRFGEIHSMLRQDSAAKASAAVLGLLTHAAP